METISPNIIVKDIHQTISFYKLLGFELIATVPEQGDYTWAMMKSGNVVFMFQTFENLAGELPAISRQDGGSLLFYIGIKNIRSFFKNIKDNVKIVKGLEKAFYGATEFSIIDNNNYILTFAEDE
jgi:uncharacterized glyoxalase superfamily protein PhnB